MTANNEPSYLTRMTIEGRHVSPPLVLIFDVDDFDINGLRHEQLVEIEPGLAIIATSMNYTRVRTELDGYVEDAAMYELIYAWVISGDNGNVRVISAPAPSSRAG